MSDDASVIGLLRGECEGFATAVTWLPSEVLCALSSEYPGRDDELGGLEAVVKAFDLDLVCVPAAVEWANAAVARLMGLGVVTCWIVAGPLTRIASQGDWTRVLRQTASDPGELAFALDEALHEALEEARAGAEAGAEALMLADELAGASGWLVSPDYAMEALIPCYRHVVEEWRSRRPAATAAVFHSDGDVRAVLDPLRQAGFDGVHFGSSGPGSIDASVAAARAAGLCPLGGIETVSLSRLGVRRTGEHIGRIARAGRMVMCDDGGITTAEEVAAFGAALGAAVEIAGSAGKGEA